MKLGFGLLSGQRAPLDDRSWRDVYSEMLLLAEDADRLGLDSIWTTEHHFVDDGYMPSLLVASAAMAARTSRIQVATGVLLAPLHDPIRLAEDAATVELLSGGRLTLGLGLGWSATEYSAFGADMRRRGRAMDEILSILRQAWSGEPLDHHGDVFDLDSVAVRPTPGGPIPILVGGSAPAAIRRAARLADGFFSNASPGRFVEQVTIANAEMDRIGRDPATFAWVNYQYVWVCDDAAKGWNDVMPHLIDSRWKYSDMEASARRGSGSLPSAPPHDADEIGRIRSQALVGPADKVAEQVAAIRDGAGVSMDFVTRSLFPGMPLTQQRDQLERQATELMPLLAPI